MVTPSGKNCQVGGTVTFGIIKGDKTPAHKCELVLAGVAVKAEDGLKGLRRDVVSFAEGRMKGA
jgi:hypothetical protein